MLRVKSCDRNYLLNPPLPLRGYGGQELGDLGEDFEKLHFWAKNGEKS